MKIWISFLLLLCCISTSLTISDAIFTSIGRNLLQAKKSCPVDFEFKNYTIITSRCKGPPYSANSCCDAFKDFACPYADDLNDTSNDCSERMFNYINLYGNYSDGLFGNLCRDDKIGLVCPALPPVTETNNAGAESNNSHNSHNIHSKSLLLTLTVGFVIFLFLWI